MFEVKLGDQFLMSSLFTTGEEALAHLGLAAVQRDQLDVVIGGLGLGHTAKAALEDSRIQQLYVIEASDAVIDWHRRRLVPLGEELVNDRRCHFVRGDFFALVAANTGYGAQRQARVDAILLDIDHTPRHLLHASHGAFYEPAGLQRLVSRLRPGGVFGLWSDDPPDEAFIATLASVFATADAHVVTFPNFYTGGRSASTVYVAVTSSAE